MSTKKFIITKEERDQVLAYMRSRNYLAAQNSLYQLEELKDQTLKSDQDRTPGKKAATDTSG